MVGGAGTCKTFLALDMALSIATGFGMGDHCVWPEIESCGPVLFAAGEGRSQISKRVKAWSKVHFNGNPIPNFRLMDPVPSITEEIEPFIEAAEAASPKDGKYKLVILDTLGRAMRGVNENAQENASAFTQMVEVIEKSLNCAGLALHHTGNNEATRARGSSVFKADADTLLLLTRKEKQMFVNLVMDKQKDAPEWTKAKVVKLNEVHLSPKTTTLVAMRAEKDEAPKDTPKSDCGASLIVLDTVEMALLAFLAENKLAKFSNIKLAEAIACDQRVELSSQQIAKRYLKAIREDNKRKAAPCYDRATGKWRYQSSG